MFVAMYRIGSFLLVLVSIAYVYVLWRGLELNGVSDALTQYTHISNVI